LIVSKIIKILFIRYAVNLFHGRNNFKKITFKDNESFSILTVSKNHCVATDKYTKLFSGRFTLSKEKALSSKHELNTNQFL